MKKAREHKNARKDYKKFLAINSLIVLSVLATMYINDTAPALSGSVIAKRVEIVDKVNISFDRTSEYLWTPSSLSSVHGLKLSGKFTGTGAAKVFIVDGGKKILVLDSASLGKKSSEKTASTDLVHESPPPAKVIAGGLSLSGNLISGGQSNSKQEDDNRTENSSLFSEGETNASTGISQEINESSNNKTDSVNLPSTEADISGNQLPQEAGNKELYNVPITFNSVCEEACLLNETKSGYKLLFEVSDSVIAIDSIAYEVVEKVNTADHIDVNNKEGKETGFHKVVENGELYDLIMEGGSSKKEIAKLNGLKHIPDKFVIKIDKDPKQPFTTDIIAADSIDFESSNITLHKVGSVNRILECNNFDLPTFTCKSSWKSTGIKFNETEDTITFSPKHFSAYAGGQINVINLQSYPSVGGNWTVRFNTTGTEDLTITPINGTTFGVVRPNDLNFIQLTCGQTILNPVFNGTSVFYPNYTCSEVGNEISKVLTPGKHHLQFNYGQSVAYANNDASWTTCGTLGTGINTLTANVSTDGTCFTFSADNSVLDCQGNSITYSTGFTQGYGIDAPTMNNITIKNCNVTQGNDFSSSAHAIRFTNTANSSISNVFTNATGSGSAGIFLGGLSGSTGNNITYSNVTSVLSSGISAGSGSINNRIENTTGQSTSGIGIEVSGNNNTLSNSTGLSSSGQGLSVSSSYNTILNTTGKSNSGDAGVFSGNSNNITLSVFVTNISAAMNFASTASNNNATNVTLNTNSSWITTSTTSSSNGIAWTFFDSSNGQIGIAPVVDLPYNKNISVDNLNFSSNKAYLKSTELTFLNTSAQIKLKGVSYTDPGPTVDLTDSGTYLDCAASRCTKQGYSNGIFIFNVTSFTSYSSKETASIASDYTKTYGGSGDDVAYSISKVTDEPNNFVFAGDTRSFGANGKDIWVIKFNGADGSILWEKRYDKQGDDGQAPSTNTGAGGTQNYVAITNVSDGFVVVGATGGSNDAWALKLNTSGGVVWQKSYDHGGSDGFTSVSASSNGSVWVGGSSYSSQTQYDAWAMKLDSNGGVLQQNTYGGSQDDYLSSIYSTSDGGAIFTGWSYSSGITTGGGDLWLAKLDSQGALNTSKSYGTTGFDYGASVIQTSDGGYAVAGKVASSSLWLMKLNSSFSIEFQKKYAGFSNDEIARSLIQTSSGGYAMAGETRTWGSGESDFWLIKTDSSGNVLFEKAYGRENDDQPYSIVGTTGGGFILAGATYSSGAGGSDAWIVSTDTAGDISGCSVSNSAATVSSTDVSTKTGFAGSTTSITGVNTSATEATTTTTLGSSCTATSVSLSSCGSVTQNTNLVGHVLNPSGTCLTLNASNIALDCKGFRVSGAYTGSGTYPAIDVLDKNNVTIKNCNINVTSSSASVDGIRLTGTNNSKLLKNKISVNNSLGSPIKLISSSNNMIANHTDFYSNDSAGLDVQMSSNNIIRQNIILNNYSSGVLIQKVTGLAVNNTLEYNNVTTLNSGSSINLTGASNTSISNTTARSDYGLAIYVDPLSTDSNITNTTALTSNGTSLYINARGTRLDSLNLTANLGTALRINSSNTQFSNFTLKSNQSWILSNSGISGSTLLDVLFGANQGSIKIIPSVTVPQNLNLSIELLNISLNRTFLNSTALSFLNTTGRIYLNDIQYQDPRPMVDLQDNLNYNFCNPTRCNEESFSANTFVFNVSGFSSYSSKEGKVNITLTKTSSSQLVEVGTQINYSIIVNNTIGDSYNVKIDEIYPPSGIAFYSSVPAPDTGTNSTFTIGNISGGNITRINITVNVSNYLAHEFLLNNTVNATYYNDTSNQFSSLVQQSMRVFNYTCPFTVTIDTNISKNIKGLGSCIIVGKNDIDLDCQGSQIMFSNTTEGIGINLTGRKNVTVRNCNVLQNNFSVSNSHAVLLSSTNQTRLGNNTFNVSSNLGEAVRMFFQSMYNNITGSVLSSNNSYPLNINFGSDFNNITKSTLYSQSLSSIFLNASNSTLADNFYIANQSSAINIGTSGINSSFSGSDITTNNTWIYSAVGAIGNSIATTVFNSSYGVISITPRLTFAANTNISTKNLNISFNRVFLNSSDSNSSFLNASGGTVSLKMLVFVDPVSRVQSDGADTSSRCSLCSNQGYSGGTYSFTVPSFSTYFAGENIYCGMALTYSADMTEDISGGDNCIRITGNNVDLNCKGYTINYSTNGVFGTGVLANQTQNVTVRNCFIRTNMTSSVVFLDGIRLEENTNGKLINNTFSLNSTLGHPIFLEKSNYTLVENNTVYSNVTAGIILRSASHNIVSKNNVTTNSSSAIFLDIITVSAINNTVHKNNATTMDSGVAILLSTALNNTISNNTARSANSIGIELGGASAWNNVSNNTIIATNGTGISISGNNNTLDRNIHIAYGGIALNLIGQSNLITNSTLNSNSTWIYAQSAAIGNSLYNTIFNATYGSINILPTATISNGTNTSVANLNISLNNTFLDSAQLSFLNTTAEITLRGITFTDPQPLFRLSDNGAFSTCPAARCTKVSFSSNVFVFNVTSFTSYSSNETIINNLPPSTPTLLQPSNGAVITNRTPEFKWANSTDANLDTLTYQIQVDNNSDFSSPEINVGSISEGGPANTSYVNSTPLAVDTTYFWKIRAFDGTSYSNYSSSFNFTLQSLLSVSIVRNSINFSTVEASKTYNTSDNSPLPILIQNNGNILVNVTAYATSLFTGVTQPTTNYRFKFRENKTYSMDQSQSTINYKNLNLTNTVKELINFNWTAVSNAVNLDIEISVPSDQPAGSLNSTITVETL